MVGLEAILEIIQILALALISVGTIILGALVAPLLFKQLSKIEAGIAVTAIFEKFSQWLEISALALFTAKLIDLVFIRKFNFIKELFFINQTQISRSFDTTYLFSFLLVIAIFAVSLYISLELMPKMVNAFEDNDAEFKRLHKRSEKLMKLNSLLALIALII
jgi:hypothetical protein